MPPKSTISATVSAFFPQLDCETADIHHSITSSVSATTSGPALGIVLDSASCTTTNSKSLCDPQTQDCPSQAFIYDMYTLNGILSNNDCRIPPDDAYISFVIGDVRYQQAASSESLPSQEVSVANISGVICKPSYGISQAHLALNTALKGFPAGASISRANNSPSTTQPEFTNANLTSVWYETLSAVGGLYNNITDVDELLFHFMANANNHSAIETLLDPSVLSAAATAVFKAVMAQFAREYLLEPADTTFEGHITYNEDRLHIRGLSVWLVVAGLLLLICTVVVVLLYKPHDVVPRNPASIAAVSTILASSDSIKPSLEGNGHLPNEALQQHLSGKSYQTALSSSGRSFMIDRHDPSNWPLPPSRLSKVLLSSINLQHHRAQSNPIPSDPSAKKEWRPYTIGLPFVMLTLALPIVTIVSLEIVQQYSDKHNGLVDTAAARASADPLAKYVPAAFMMALSILFNSFGFAVMIFAPYSALAKGNSQARKSIMSSLQGKLPILSLIQAITEGHWAVLHSTTAAIVGSFLTIVVSGLYVTNAVPGSSGIPIQQIDQFNLNWTNSVKNDSNAGTMFALTEKQNFSYPRFTYDEIVLPRIQLTGQNEASQDVLQVQLPATRAALNCTVVPPQGITVSTISSGSTCEANITVQAPLPAICLFGGPGGNDPSVTFDNSFQMSPVNARLNETYGGKLLDLHVAPSFGDSLDFQSFGDDVESSETDNPPGCPSLGFIFGHFTCGDNANVDATALICSQLAEEIQTETHFLLPNLDLDPSNPPKPDEGTVKPLVNQTGSIPYRIQAAFDSEVAAYNSTSRSQSDSPTMLDPFFQALLYGQDSVDPSSLIGTGNTDRLISATRHIYRRYMAQAFNSNMRHDLSAADRITVDATLIHPDKSRLTQDKPSKIVLQVLLAVIFVCGLAAYLLVDTKRVLPHSPTSIAGVASLLAGSELIDRNLVPKGSEWMSDTELKSQGVFEGQLYGLGWWEGTEEGKGRRFGIGVGKAEGRL